MNSLESRVLHEVRNGQVSTCYKLNLGDPRIVEIAGLCGFSAVWLCNEHVANDWLNLENMIRAARLHGMDSIVRVNKGSYSDYLKPFESGASGIMVPHISSPKEAEKIVETTRFKPIGRRPLDGGNVDGRFCLMPLTEYLHAANKEQYVILQIESPEAVDCVEDIAAVPGYEGLLFGPGDYLHLIGKPGDSSAPELDAARRRVESAARKNGKFCMSVGYTDTPESMQVRGYGIAVLGADILALGNALQLALKTFDPTGHQGHQRFEKSFYERKS